jgi:hypothetical protein
MQLPVQPFESVGNLISSNRHVQSYFCRLRLVMNISRFCKSCIYHSWRLILSLPTPDAVFWFELYTSMQYSNTGYASSVQADTAAQGEGGQGEISAHVKTLH